MITVMNCLPLILTALLFVSCGKSVQEENEPEVQEEVNTDGTYSTFLLPTNNNISPHVSGLVRVSKFGDDFRVEVKLKDSPGGVHRQYLQTGSSCKNLGDKLVPFDDDLSGQYRGHGFFPSGNYHYKRSTSYYLMLSDLHLPDDNTTDGIVKLQTWDLPLEKRAVVVYTRSANGDIAIACGLLTKVSSSERDDTWSEPPRTPTRVEPRPRPRPRPEPRPRPVPQPAPDVRPDENNDTRSTTWWERMWDRFRRWRDRATGRENPTNHTT